MSKLFKRVLSVFLSILMVIGAIQIDQIYADETGSFYGYFHAIEDGEEVAVSGLNVSLNDLNGNKVSTAVTDENGKFAFSGIAQGEYRIKLADASYVPDEDAEYYESLGGYEAIILSGRESTFSKGGPIIIKKVDQEIIIYKKSTDTLEQLPTAQLAIYKANDLENPVKTFTTTTEPTVISGLEYGDYVLKEIKAPAGYTLAENINFTYDGQAIELTMYDEPQKAYKYNIRILKSSIASETNDVVSYILGATLRLEKVVDGQNVLIEEWVSAAEWHVVEDLTAGHYILTEVGVPKGFTQADPIEFDLLENGTSEIKYIMEDGYTWTEIIKVDDNGNAVSGARLAIYNENNEKVTEFVTDGTTTKIKGLAAGKYKLVELEAPERYEISEPVEFVVTTENDAENPVVVRMLDRRLYNVEFVKYVKGTEEFLPDAELKLEKINSDSSRVIIDEWRTTTRPYVIENLYAGKYVLTETYAPDGYIVSKEIEFVLDDTTPETKTVIMEDDYTKVKISKKDSYNDDMLIGATLQIIDKYNNVIEEWVTDDEEHIINARLIAGETYTLHEVSAPMGYEVADDITFTVNTDGTVNDVVMYDVRKPYEYTLNITKQSLLTNNELPGATLKLSKIEDNQTIVIDEWVSTEEAHVIDGLLAGDYELTEITAPNGYIKAETIEFTLLPDGSSQTNYTMKDDYTKVSIVKQDAETKQNLVGARLQLFDENDNMLEEWISDEEPYVLNAILLPGKTYVLKEIIAPSGYELADDITFTVNTDGTVNNIVMYDAKKPYEYKLNITKKSLLDSEELPGAVLKLSKIENNQAVFVEQWTSTNKAHVISGLLAGDYELTEITAPNGYVKAETIKFTLLPDGSSETDYVMEDDYTEINVVKQDKDTKKNLAGATLQIIDKNGRVVDEWASTTEAHIIKAELIAGETYTLHETKAPVGYELADDITFTVNTDGTVNRVVMYDKEITYNISVLKLVEGANSRLSGAVLKLEKVDGTNRTLIEQWTTNGEAKTFSGLKAGNYEIVEVSCPAGYLLSDPVKFTLLPDGSSETDYVMYDDYTKVIFEKKDAETKENLAGAVLQIIDENDNVIAEWTTTTDVKMFFGKLAAGKTYTLHEKTAPAGYKLAEDMTFTVNTDGTAMGVVMYDEAKPYEYTLNITKKSLLDSEELPGATLKLSRIENNQAVLVEQWVSTEEAHVIDGLLAGDYELTEITAPNGYIKAESIRFTLLPDGSSETDYEMKDDYTKVSIEKKDAETKENLVGATLQIIDNEGDIVDEWVSTTEPHIINAELIAGATYTLKETVAPVGYLLAEDIKFTVDSEGEIDKIVMYDKARTYDINITKEIIASDEELPGAVLKLEKVDGTNRTLVEQWTSTNEAHVISGLKAGNYELTEITAPDGYIKAETIKFTLLPDGSSETNYVMEDDYTKVSIVKQDADTKENLAGAKLQIIDSEDNVVETWTSTNEAHVINAKLIAGATYTLKEVEAPVGYLLAENVEFTVNNDGTVNKIVMYDKARTYDIDITKKIIASDEELPGAVLKLEKVDGENVTLVEQWTSTNEAHVIKGLSVGIYRLTEITAPAGYVKTESIEFELLADGTSQTSYVMEDDYTKVSIVKQDADTKENLAGAKLALYDADNKLVAEWTSTKEPYVLNAKLIAGATYTLKEVEAPVGYLLAEDIKFTVNTNGTVNNVIMHDEGITYDIDITKMIISSDEELPGAVLKLEKVDGTNRTLVEQWTSTNEAHVIKGLRVGKYILTEVTAPAGYVKAESIEFELLADGTSKTSYVMYDDFTKVAILKQDADTKKNLAGAKLALYTEDGKLVAEWKSTKEAFTINKLAPGKYILKEVDAPDGYKLASDVTFEVKETEKLLTVVMYDKKKPNEPDDEPDDEPEPEPEPEPEKPNVVQTGDDNNLNMFMAMFGILSVSLLGLLYKIKKNKE